VFVNLFGGTAGAAMTYPAVHQLIGRIAARTGISFTARMLRHSHATGMVCQGVPIEVVARLLTPPLPSDHQPDLCPSQRGRHPGGAVSGRSVAEGAGCPVNYPVPAAEGKPRLQVVAGEAALDGQRASDRWNAARLGIPARRGRGHARFDQISQSPAAGLGASGGGVRHPGAERMPVFHLPHLRVPR
jgi:hypothetical protein